MEQLSFNQSLSGDARALSSGLSLTPAPVSLTFAESATRTAPELMCEVAHAAPSHIDSQQTIAIADQASAKRRQKRAHGDRSGNQAASAETGSEGGNVTEIILPAGQVENMQLLLPMLTQLNRERRWLAWIDPPAELVRKWQQMHGIVTGEILVLRSTDSHDGLSLAKRALSAGTCHAVVMWTPDRLGNAAFRSLQSASANGSSHGVILRQR